MVADRGKSLYSAGGKMVLVSIQSNHIGWRQTVGGGAVSQLPLFVDSPTFDIAIP
jgi:hypothetical protein